MTYDVKLSTGGSIINCTRPPCITSWAFNSKSTKRIHQWTLTALLTIIHHVPGGVVCLLSRIGRHRRQVGRGWRLSSFFGHCASTPKVSQQLEGGCPREVFLFERLLKPKRDFGNRSSDSPIKTELSGFNDSTLWLRWPSHSTLHALGS